MKKVDDYPSLFDDDFSVISPESSAAKPPAEPAIRDREPLMFMSFGSGSSGNCCFLGSRKQGILIDAGVEGKMVEEAMRANGLSMDNIQGIIVTHDHSDHVKFLYNIVRYHRHIRIYSTPRVLTGLLQKHGISKRIKEFHNPIFKEHPFQVAGMTITAFDVMHDGSDNAGFYINTAHGDFAIATDLGCISDRVDFYLSKAEYIVLEANYDAAMLRDGRYPEYLKARIIAPNGHLDNMVTAAFLKKIYSSRLANIFLCHLSHDNNKPAIALHAVKQALTEAGEEHFSDGLPSLTDFLTPLHLVALPRFKASPLYILRPRSGGRLS